MNKSGVSSQVLSLPRGGGALSGLGETFAPDLHTGTGNFTVAVPLPAGRQGLTPALSLQYSTGTANGPFGLGWSLSLPRILRKTSRGVPRYGDTDTFLLSGAEDLVEVWREAGRVRYRPRVESGFARIDHRTDGGRNLWEVSGLDGLMHQFGTLPPPACQDWRDPAVIADPRRGTRRFCWLLARTVDTFGNAVEYSYERDAVTREGPHEWDQVYLSEIRYADHGDPQRPDFLVSVRFVYERRPDPFSDHRAGFEIRTVRRCTAIEVTAHPGRAIRTRTYLLRYADQLPSGAADLPRNGVSLLARVEVVGYDDAGTAHRELPPLDLGYSRFAPEQTRALVAVTGGDLPHASLSHPEYELADIDANGLPDLVEMNGTIRSWRNSGDGTFALVRPMGDAPAGVTLADPGVQLLDADGDGRIDLLVCTRDSSGYYPLDPGGGWDRRSFRQHRFAPSFDLMDPEVKLVDLDGDGVTDAVRAGARLECFFNDAREGWRPERTRFVERRTPEDFPNVSFADPRVKWGDLSGDGLQDIAIVNDGSVEYWPALGHGEWGRRVRMSSSPRLPDRFDPRRVLLSDLDGDGLEDLVYVGHRQVTVWINRSGNAWSDPIEIPGTPESLDIDSVRTVDLLGRGTRGIFWSGGASAGWPERFFLDLTGDVKPYLLERMDAHTGAVTRVTYCPSTRFYLEDERQPATRWRTTLPFPVQVVERVEVVDEISGSRAVSRFRYRHGYWDGVEREFRGFGCVEQIDAEDRSTAGEREGSVPPVLTRTWFHLGPVGRSGEELSVAEEFWNGDPPAFGRLAATANFLGALSPDVRRIALRALRGSTSRVEVYALDGSDREDRPYTVTEQLHGLCEIADVGGEPRLAGMAAPAAAPERARVFFAHALAQRATSWERGDDPLSQFTFSDDYEDHGRPRALTDVWLPRRSLMRRPLVGVTIGEVDIDERLILAAHTRHLYASPDPGLHLFARLAHTVEFGLTAPPEVAERDPGDLTQVLRDQASSAYSVHREFLDALDSWRPGQQVPAALTLAGHQIHHYDGGAFAGRPAGEVGPHGALTRTETLVFTSQGLDRAYGADRPGYLGGSAPLPVGAPAGFGANLGYRLETRSAAGYQDGYYADTERYQRDVQTAGSPHRRGIVTAMRDARGDDTAITPDAYWLFPARLTDAAGLETQVEHDHRAMQVRRVVDPNGNAANYRYTASGLLQKEFLVGRSGEGGSEAQPEVEFEYDFLAFERTRNSGAAQPIFVHSRRRVHHASAGVSDDTIEARQYSDGFGRVIQTRAQGARLVFGESGDDVGLPADPGAPIGAARGVRRPDHVVVSGWQVYDTRGRPVRVYESFHGSGWAFQPEAESRQGRHATLVYDARGQLIRTIGPDGSQQWTVLGIPVDLADPRQFTPTPWARYSYDANDLGALAIAVPGSAPAAVDAAHHFTPSSTVIDARGRVLATVDRNGAAPAQDWYITRSRYDRRGNLIERTDALGRPAFRHVYDLAGNLIRTESADAGIRTSVLDARGKLVETRTSAGAVVLREYDRLNRLTRVWARDAQAAPLTLREQVAYGDQGNHAVARSSNLLGLPVEHADEAGILRIGAYDFKGNPLERQRRVVADSALAAGWVADWSAASAGAALATTSYDTSLRHDALDRVTEITLPADVTGQRRVVAFTYDSAGTVEQVHLDGAPYVAHIAYNARGARTLIVYGSGVMTRYSYDPASFRLARLRTDRLAPMSVPDRWAGSGVPLQEFSYRYDRAGNIVAIEERVPGCGIDGSADGRDLLKRRFEYDPLYRLTHSDGRACANIPGPRPLEDVPRCGASLASYAPGPPAVSQGNAPFLTQRYEERYTYDPAGNLIALAHAAGGRSWTRDFGLAGLAPGQAGVPANNRATAVRQDGTTRQRDYDAAGRLIREDLDRHHAWDHAGRRVGFRIQAGATPSIEARYLYAADGRRVKKWVGAGNTGAGASTVFIDSVFEHHTDAGLGLSNNEVHLMDGRRPIARVRIGPAHPRDGGPPVQYQLADHLSSCHLVTDAAGSWVNREEYFPFGETSFGSFARKRYRFAGRERDLESGFFFHGARYYAPALGRWISPDPVTPPAASSLYAYGANDPLRHVDPDGLDIRYFDILFLGAEPTDAELDEYNRNPTAHNIAFLGAGVGTAATAAAGGLILLEAAPALSVLSTEAKVAVTTPFVLETAADAGNVAVATWDVSTNPTPQGAAGLSLAVGDLVTGPGMTGELNTARVAAERGGKGGGKSGGRIGGGRSRSDSGDKSGGAKGGSGGRGGGSGKGGGGEPDDELVTLQHGTTLTRAMSISRSGPDENFTEPGGTPAGGFSTAKPGDDPSLVGSPAAYAAGKAKANLRDVAKGIAEPEGGPAIVEVKVPKSIVDKALQTGGEVRFEPGHGLEELKAAWPSLQKTLRGVKGSK